MYPNRRHPAVLGGMTRIRTARCLALFAATLAAACGAPADKAARRPASVFEDPGTARWTLAPSPRLAIGGDDERDGYLIGSLAGALLLGDRLVVADGSAREL
ncbi:MAG TPA: hypothetical protein VNL18_06760, partial [Gemmatimonadales bacterium]|nr:hypothetical protein [Gemmatimonadales bacterium]